MSEELLKERIMALVEKLYAEREAKRTFVAGKTRVRFSGDIYDQLELKARVSAVLKEWITLGEYDVKFREEFSRFMGMKHIVLTNSGSSANLLAVSALCAKSFPGRLVAGDEVITPACTFPTTLNPIIFNNLVPVFVDVSLGTYNVSAKGMEKAISKKTRAVFIPHTLGNPNEMDGIMSVCEEHGLLLIEDNCDALDSSYGGKKTGTFGLMGTSSFYPAHHLSMGEGGAVYTNDHSLFRTLLSLRNWGRACYCDLDEKNPLGSCNARFNFRVKGIPYDHKYIYSNIGFNLKPLDLQPAVGIEQLRKLPSFTEKRKRNFSALYSLFSRYSDYFILPESVPKADPSWFGFPLTIRDGAGFTREEFTSHLEANLIETRVLFAGNILNHPAYDGIRCRVAEPLVNSDKIFRSTMFMGVYPGIGPEQLSYIESVVTDFFRKRKTLP
ncbi:MAG TPA: lipopolysaccharide biosynthesis protein RfbH [Candidatus Diapherotrites archaeon]|uniref:Lipopolysaccharide biosynthesis protein RfbH n=1 Tax=Candidatus Iainarchaeum sp. TaxID=3101447 RepID=A0A7J4IWL3_9ARCH|nr:lipopolysaccharide biosynthesis protein RfbH [Candidatus Diapherotrites archaeon]